MRRVSLIYAGVSEWIMEAVLKTVGGDESSLSSNLSSGANIDF